MAGRKVRPARPTFERKGKGRITAGSEIFQEEAARLFERIAEETLHGDRELFDSLTEHERKVVVDWMSNAIVDGNAENALHDVLWEVDYVRRPVDIETFIHDDFFFGRIAKDLHPKWKEDLYKVFAFDSQVFEWVMCLSGDTRVPLLDGTSRTLEDLHREFERTGASFWVYSYSKDGRVVPGHCTRVTKFRPDQLYKVTLDDGATVRANSDHEFVCHDGVKRKLRDLRAGDRLMQFQSFYDRIVRIERDVVEPVYCLTVPECGNFALDLGDRRGIFSGNTGAIGIGKAVSVDSRALTPVGWKRAGDVRLGEYLIGRSGKPVRVCGVFPQGVRPLYRVRFSDGAVSVVDADHLWAVRTPSDAYRGRDFYALTTRELWSDLRIRHGARKWHVPVVAPVEYETVQVPLPPYAVGALIGDGCLVSGGIRLSSDDPEIVEEVATELGLESKHTGYGCDYRLVRARGDREGHPLAALRELGLCVLSHQKRVPPAYLRASVHDRRRLLAGLLDTDGWVQNGGSTTGFSTSSPGLATDVVELVRSLGGIARRTLKQTDGLTTHVLTIRMPECPFFLSRKRRAWKPTKKRGAPVRLIDSISRGQDGEAVCFSVEAADNLFVIDDFVVTHNTTLAGIGMGYKLYLMSCLRDPARYYGLLPGSQIIFGVYSITKRQVADTGYNNIRGYVDTSPYFRQQFPRSTKIDSKVDFYPRTKRRIQIIPGSQELHALGLNLFAFLMDEVNFMRVKDDKDAGIMKGQAYTLYNATYTRLLSRFTRKGGTLPGMMFLLSSRNAETSFLEEHLRKVKGSEHSHATYVSDYALWEVKNKQFTWPGFKVEVGDRVSRSRLLKKGEQARVGARIVEVPWEYHKPFTEDVDQALRDIAGVATFNLSPLISDRPSIFEAVSDALIAPFTRDDVVADMQDDTLIEDYFILKAACKVTNSVWKPKLNREAPRYIHVDIGLTNDCLGIAMAHVAGRVRNDRVNPDGTLSVMTNPYIVVDLMLRVTARPGAEVDLSKVRAFILYLRNLGYPITRVTFDQFQSSDSIQILKKQGIESGHQSVDRDDTAYLSLRSTFFDRRIATYEYKPFQDEVLDLQRDPKKRKVDHPQRASNGRKGSKDVADAVAGAIWLCMNDERALHSSIADIEMDRTGPARKQPTDLTRPSEGVKQVGAAKLTWDALRRNLDV